MLVSAKNTLFRILRFCKLQLPFFERSHMCTKHFRQIMMVHDSNHHRRWLTSAALRSIMVMFLFSQTSILDKWTLLNIYFSLCTTCFGTQPWSRAAFNWNGWPIFFFHFYKSESEISVKNKLDNRNTKKGKVTNNQSPRKSFLKNIPLRGILTLSPLLSPPPLGHLFSRYWTPFSPG